MNKKYKTRKGGVVGNFENRRTGTMSLSVPTSDINANMNASFAGEVEQA